jgi:hypothetical protein
MEQKGNGMPKISKNKKIINYTRISFETPAFLDIIQSHPKLTVPESRL